MNHLRLHLIGAKKARKRPRKLEEPEQIKLANWLDSRRTGRLHGPLRWAHVPNGGERHAMVGLNLKLQGAKAGVPDCLIFDRPPKYQHYVGTAVELKQPKGGEVSESQRKWLEDLERLGWCTMVCHGAKEAIRALEQLGY